MASVKPTVLPASISGDPAEYLRPTHFVDSDHPAVVAYATEATEGCTTPIDRAQRLFLTVRDGLRYDPYTFSLDPEAYRASTVVHSSSAFCVPKAILLTAVARAVGIPALVGFADVRNHLTSERLRALMGTDVFVFHGYSVMYLDECWVKATPAFDTALCDHFGVQPLIFDGHTDAMFHELTPDGARHMEYIRDRGHYADLPFDSMLAAFDDVYGSGNVIADTDHDDAFHSAAKDDS
ncbi:MAG: transglutaminase [Deltaproteobacteria bacterium]|nr:MAG: transglutaminase [Deltaproteobacteria bacterium]